MMTCRGWRTAEPDKQPLDAAEAEQLLRSMAEALRPTLVTASASADDDGAPPALLLPSGAEDLGIGALGADARSHVPVPRFKAVYQARAATRRRRTAADIDTIVLHTPEGYEGGTLEVLKGTQAGFDVYLAPDGDLYKCNDWFNFYSWQAGDRNYNPRSVGFEIDSFASTSGDWTVAFYRQVAHVCAWLIETLGVPLRHAQRYGDPGLIYYRTITPKRRSEPGLNFRMPLLLDLLREYLKGRDPDPKRAPLERIWFCCHPYPLNEDARYAEAAVAACRAVGLGAAELATGPDAIRCASYRVRHANSASSWQWWFCRRRRACSIPTPAVPCATSRAAGTRPTSQISGTASPTTTASRRRDALAPRRAG